MSLPSIDNAVTVSVPPPEFVPPPVFVPPPEFRVSDATSATALSATALAAAELERAIIKSKEEYAATVSYQYWRIGSVPYKDFLEDGFYAIFGDFPGKIMDVAWPGPDNIPHLDLFRHVRPLEGDSREVILVDHSVDSNLCILEKDAAEAVAKESTSGGGPEAKIKALATVVSNHMGGPYDTEDDLNKLWIATRKSNSIQRSVLLHLGLIRVGTSRHRALLFKLLADSLSIENQYLGGPDGAAMNMVKLHGKEWIVDLVVKPGRLFPPPEVRGPDATPARALEAALVERVIRGIELMAPQLTATQQTVIPPSVFDAEQIQHLDARQSQRHVYSKEGFVSEIWADIEYEDGNVRFTTLQSPNDMYRLELDNGRMVILSASGASSYHTPEQAQVGPGWYLMMQSDRNLVIYDNERNPKWCSETWKHDSRKAGLRLMDTGDCHLVNSEGELLMSFQSPPLMTHPSISPPNGPAQPSGFARASAPHNAAFPARTESSVLSMSSDPNILVPLTSPFGAVDPAALGFNFSSFGPSFDPSSSIDQANVSTSSPTRNASPVVGSTAQATGSTSPRPNWVIEHQHLKYSEHDLVGFGSFGQVYKAKLCRTEVAVKKLGLVNSSRNVLADFRAEVKVMLELRHANIVTFYGAVVTMPNLAIVTALANKGDLFRILHHERLDLTTIRRLDIAQDIAQGMCYVHNCKLMFLF
eukprot:gene14006-19940_t